MSRGCAGLLLALVLACATPEPEASAALEAELRQFALANCLLAHFQARGWDDRDIRGIAGGIVETGSAGPDTYVAIAETVRAWNPDIRTKHDLDVGLVKCFRLDENEALERLIEDASRS